MKRCEGQARAGVCTCSSTAQSHGSQRGAGAPVVAHTRIKSGSRRRESPVPVELCFGLAKASCCTDTRLLLCSPTGAPTAPGTGLRRLTRKMLLETSCVRKTPIEIRNAPGPAATCRTHMAARLSVQGD